MLINMHCSQPLRILFQQFCIQLFIIKTCKVRHLDKSSVVNITAIQIIKFLKVPEIFRTDSNKLVENLQFRRISDSSVCCIGIIIFTIGNEDTKCRITASIIINRHSLFNNRRITLVPPEGP